MVALPKLFQFSWKKLFSFRQSCWNVVIWFQFDAWCCVSSGWVHCCWLEHGGQTKAVIHSHHAPQQLPPGNHLHTHTLCGQS